MARGFKHKNGNGNGIEASLEALQHDFSALQTNMGKLVAGLGNAASDGMASAVRSASDTAEDAIEQVEDLGQEGVNAARRSIRSQPIVSCAISLGAGALIGALLARQ